MDMLRSWKGFWGWQTTLERKNRASSSISRPHSHGKKRKLKQKPQKNKRKRKGQKSGCDNSSPLKEISSSRFDCSGNKYAYTDLRRPLSTQVSFFFYWLFPLNSLSDLPDWLWGGLLYGIHILTDLTSHFHAYTGSNSFHICWLSGLWFVIMTEIYVRLTNPRVIFDCCGCTSKLPWISDQIFLVSTQALTPCVGFFH